MWSLWRSARQFPVSVFSRVSICSHLHLNAVTDGLLLDWKGIVSGPFWVCVFPFAFVKSHRDPQRDSGSTEQRYRCDVENTEWELSERHWRFSSDLPYMTRSKQTSWRSFLREANPLCPCVVGLMFACRWLRLNSNFVSTSHFAVPLLIATLENSGDNVVRNCQDFCNADPDLVMLNRNQIYVLECVEVRVVWLSFVSVVGMFLELGSRHYAQL